MGEIPLNVVNKIKDLGLIEQIKDLEERALECSKDIEEMKWNIATNLMTRMEDLENATTMSSKQILELTMKSDAMSDGLMKQIEDQEEHAMEWSKEIEGMKLKRDATNNDLIKEIKNLEERATESSNEIEEMKLKRNARS